MVCVYRQDRYFLLAAERQPGDVVLLAPWWTERARIFVPEGLPVVGYAEGYRASWGAAVGRTSAEVFEDNLKAWCGDHCVDPVLVPGVLFSNLKIKAETPGIEDMAATALGLFGVAAPGWMEGRSVV